MILNTAVKRTSHQLIQQQTSPSLGGWLAGRLHLLEALLGVPLVLPAGEPRAVLEGLGLPSLLDYPPFDLLPLVLLEGRDDDVLGVPGVLVLHEAVLAVGQHLLDEAGHVGLVAELGERREEGLEVEDDGGRQGQAAQRLPVDAEMNTLGRQGGVLDVAVGTVRVPGRHVEGLVDLEAPGAALDGPGGGHLGEEAVHAELHLLPVVRDRLVDLVQLHPDLGAHVPAQRRADHARPQVVVTRFGVPQHDAEVFRYVV